MTEVARLSLLQVYVNGPNPDFVLNGHNLKQYGKDQLVAFEADGTHPGEFTFRLPETLRTMVAGVGDVARDSFTLSIRAQYDPTPGVAPDTDKIDMVRNPTLAFGATEEGTPVARMSSADTAKCNRCHGDLRVHGGASLAKNVEECAMCHTASFDTSARQGATKVSGSTTSLRLSTMVHRIHAGSFASGPYIAYGFAPMAPYPPVDLSKKPFPGDVQDCASCHFDDARLVPLRGGSLVTTTHTLDANGTIISSQ